MQASITLGGRKFSGVSQSVSSSQHDYIQAHVRLAGAVEILAVFNAIGARVRELPMTAATVLASLGRLPRRS